MTKTIFKTLLSLLILFSISCGDRPTGSGGTIGDNKETPQTETPASKEFLKNFDSLAPQYTGKIEEIYDSEYNRKEYSFDEKIDMTVEGTKYTFWGMAPDNNQIAYYYKDTYPYNFGLIFKDGNLVEDYEESQKIGSAIFDYSSGGQPSVKNPTDTSGNETWTNNVKGKKFTSKSMTTYNYTFEVGGNIKETTGSGEYAHTETYYFWGALDSSRVVYYKKEYYNVNQEVWEYCGFSFDIANNKFNKYSEYSQAYYNSLKIWNQNNLDSEGNPKPNANFETYPLPKRSDIDWNKYTTGTLTTR